MFIFNSHEHQQAVQQLNNLWNNLQALADLAFTLMPLILLTLIQLFKH